MPIHLSQSPAPAKESSLSQRATIALCDELAAAGQHEIAAILDVGREAIARHGADAEVLTAVGRLYLGCGLTEDAVRALTAAVRVGGGARAYRLLGEALLRQGDAQIAVAMLGRALAEGDGDASTRALQATAQRYVRLQRDQGEQAVAREVALGSSDLDAIDQRATIPDAAPAPSQRPGMFGRLATWGLAAPSPEGARLAGSAPSAALEPASPASGRVVASGTGGVRIAPALEAPARAEPERLPRFPSDPDWEKDSVQARARVPARVQPPVADPALAPSDAPWSMDVDDSGSVDFDLDEHDLANGEIIEPSASSSARVAITVERLDDEISIADPPTVDRSTVSAPQTEAAPVPAPAVTASSGKSFTVGASRGRPAKTSRASRIAMRSATVAALFVASYLATRALSRSYGPAPSAHAPPREEDAAAVNPQVLMPAAPARGVEPAQAGAERDTSAASAAGEALTAVSETGQAKSDVLASKTAKSEAPKPPKPAKVETPKTAPKASGPLTPPAQPSKAEPPAQKSGNDALWLGDPERR